MFNKIHTYIFLISLILYICIGLYAVFTQSLIAGIIYLAILFIGSFTIAYTCCTKCRFNKTSCRHIIPGILTRFFSKTKQKKFTIYNLFLIYTTTAIIIIFSQIWLWNIKYLFVIFWLMVIINVIENLIIFKSYFKE
jgi:hypothetical protein